MAWLPALVKLIQVAVTGVSLYDSVKGRQQKPPTQDTAKADNTPTSPTDVTDPQKRLSTLEANVTGLQQRLGTLETGVTELQGRLDTLEANEKSQDEWLAQIEKHETVLLRGLIVLILASVATGAVAIAALVMTVLR